MPYDVTEMPIDQMSEYFNSIELTERQQMIGKDILKEII